ncbi:MAG: hypothetical protein KatS3mg024_2630 [Armatimonadota bacterium]|nr:MAG: hypothetical protein KatS3mg024_2630 [Armatimonadota bacterium]
MTRARMLVIFAVLLFPTFGQAAELVRLPQGTVVPLALEAPLTTREAAEGDRVAFRVADDVWVGTRLVIRKGEPVEAIITDVGRPGGFGRSGRISLQFGSVRAVDGKMVDLMPWDRERLQRVGYAAGAAVGGVAVLGPIGAVGGLFVKGKHLELPAGHVVNAAVRWEYALEAPPPAFLTAEETSVPESAAEPAPPVPPAAPAAGESDLSEEPDSAAAPQPPAATQPAKPEEPVAAPLAPVIPIIEDVTDAKP